MSGPIMAALGSAPITLGEAIARSLTEIAFSHGFAPASNVHQVARSAFR
jgi:hypothetical protein